MNSLFDNRRGGGSNPYTPNIGGYYCYSYYSGGAGDSLLRKGGGKYSKLNNRRRRCSYDNNNKDFEKVKRKSIRSFDLDRYNPKD